MGSSYPGGVYFGEFQSEFVTLVTPVFFEMVGNPAVKLIDHQIVFSPTL